MEKSFSTAWRVNLYTTSNESTCQALLTGLMLLFSELHSEYPDNIEVMEA